MIFSCNQKEELSDSLFKPLSTSHTSISFNNKITETDTLNYFNYPYLYMGGGAAIGDFDNDGLQDLFFTGNMVESKLYKNEGNLKFKDVTKPSGIKNNDQWFTGASLVDINQDGFLDIYVSVSGKQNKANKLYINNQDLTFTESASQYGLDNEGSTTQVAFFDYDNDNDLDLYIANYPPANFGSSNAFYKSKMDNLTEIDSDKLFRNEGNGTFKDVSIESGIANYGLSLGLSVADYNNDGLLDVYVSNDFSTPDYLWVNNGDGTFTNQLEDAFGHTSFYAMGCDAADFNNDGWIDFVQVDMTPNDNRRAKSNMASMNRGLFWDTVDYGFHYQYMQNSLQLNRGNKKQGVPYFSDISRISGLATTDWSWGPLLADFDNDGWKDLFITNGTKRDVNNKDYFQNLKLKINLTRQGPPINSLDIPSEPVENCAYKNNGDGTFSNIGLEWGINYKGFSNGATYGDLDNDGDLDLVVNNMDSEASIYENTTNDLNSNYVRFKLNGPEANHFGIGTRIKIYQQKNFQEVQVTLTRGFQSSVEPIAHFGLPKNQKIDSVKIYWTDFKTQTLKNLTPNQTISVNYSEANLKNSPIDNKEYTYNFINISDHVNIDYNHEENNYNDFFQEPLLPHQYSKMGPGLAVSDVNNDGLSDIFIGNATAASAKLFIQNTKGEFIEVIGPWQEQIIFEDMAATFFDADNDGDPDLYVGSGSNEFAQNSKNYRDRLYMNDGQGNYTENIKALPNLFISTGTISEADYDGDGDIDLFIGGRIMPAAYPLAASSYLLKNELIETGHLSFKDITNTYFPSLNNIGLVTDALWTDFDNDKDLDVVISKEWGPIGIYENENGKFIERTSDFELDEHLGWWYSLAQGDFDNDGDIDFIAGNLGNNYKYQASKEAPFEVYSGDYDNNRKRDIVLGYHQKGTLYPLRGRECSSEQIPAIKYKFKNYESFANASLVDVYGEDNLKSGIHYKANTFSTVLIENKGNDEWAIRDLPIETQLSSVNKILVNDYNKDGNLDIIIGGNLYASEVETTRNDASIGLYLEGKGNGAFNAIPSQKSGLYLDGDVKDMEFMQIGSDLVLVVARNNDTLKFIKVYE
ncbi:hypothetical protein GCM10007028_25540 [Algibacter mikhailovii]|uniref:ASPIC/UnbV domain-containing protein n=1 Tax=Algibacter mikhailovii TaxID=425498 RepID=A0A918R618_9FLAO|nr:hypothetical protein GCM10007028_25540 [Algibacter mikhailovii]